MISAKKDEPEWLLEWRLKAFEAWQAMEEPDWAKLDIMPDRLPGDQLLGRAEAKAGARQHGRRRPEIRDMFDKLGIPLHEQKMLSNVAVDAMSTRCR